MNQSTVSSRERKLHKALAAEQAENRRLRAAFLEMRAKQLCAESALIGIHRATFEQLPAQMQENWRHLALSQLEELDRTAMPGPWRLTTQMGIPGEGTVYGIKCGVGYQMTGFGRPEAEMLVVMRNALPGLLREIREQAVTIESLQADIDRLKAALKMSAASANLAITTIENSPAVRDTIWMDTQNLVGITLCEFLANQVDQIEDLFKEAGK